MPLYEVTLTREQNLFLLVWAADEGAASNRAYADADDWKDHADAESWQFHRVEEVENGDREQADIEDPAFHDEAE